MNEPKSECEKRENNVYLREKMELAKDWDEIWKDGGQDQCETSASAEWDEAYEGEREEGDRARPPLGLLLLF